LKERKLMQTLRRVGIVVVNFNGLDDTLKCCASLLRLNSDNNQVQFVVVDNGSSPSQHNEIRRAFPSFHVIRNESNLGWSGGNNTGIRYCLDQGCDAVILLNNDTVVSPELVTVLCNAFASSPSYGVIGPVIRFMDEPEAVMTDGVLFNQSPIVAEFFARKAVQEDQERMPQIIPVDIVNGCCLMIKREVFDLIGLIDDRFFLIHEESDFCLRSSRAGYTCGVLARGLVWHKGSSSFKRSAPGWQRYYDVRNLGLLLAKHAGRLPRSRGFIMSWLHYLAYVSFLYSKDRAAGGSAGSKTAVTALYDFLSRRFGRYEEQRERPLVTVLDWALRLFVGARQLVRRK
jgi:hypothetical protein